MAIFALLLVFTSHGDLVLRVNEKHSPFSDTLFKYWTHLGDGVLLGILGLFLLCTSYFRCLLFLVGVAVQTVFVHVFKQWLYANEPRPKVFFSEIVDSLHFVEGVAVRGYDSFPSGHTTSGFFLFYFLISLVKNEVLRLFFFVIAVGVGFSRIYLMQHFGRDVFFGSFFGILSVIFAYALMNKYQEKTNLKRGLLTT